MKIGIYKITSPKNKIYIGQSIELDKREYVYSLLHCKSQHKLYNSLKKYGWNNHTFEVIYELPIDINIQILNDYEKLYWEQYKDVGFEMLNIAIPGNNKKHSEETKKKIGITNKGKPSWVKGKKQSKESNFKRSIAHKGKKLSLHHRKKLSISHNKKVIQFNKNGEFLNEYESYLNAKKITGIDCQFALVGKCKSAGGFLWKYKEEWDGFNLPKYKPYEKRIVIF